MKNRTVFIGGVHGVGKTHFCNSLVGRFDVEHVTASSLIGQHINHSEDKTVSNIEKNQLILADELSRYQTNCRTILLDGHFCLLNSNSDIQDVPLATFKAISPYAIFLLKDDPASIVVRLSNRDDRAYSTDLLSTLQVREIERAGLVSQSLNVPLIVIEPMVDFDKSLKEVATYL